MSLGTLSWVRSKPEAAARDQPKPPSVMFATCVHLFHDAPSPLVVDR